MKAGTFLLVLTLALVLLGFLIHANFETRSDLARATDAVTTLQSENRTLAEQVAQQDEELSRLKEQNIRLELDNHALNDDVAELNSKVQTLWASLDLAQANNEKLQALSTELTAAADSPLTVGVLYLQHVLSPTTGETTLATSFVPVVFFGSGVFVYLFYHHYRRKHLQGTYVVRVTRQELEALLRHRRSKRSQ